jgi:uncharacterized protein YhbP (UPF0306 family)
MSPLDSAKKCFDEGRVMQLGTSHDGQPRVNTVFYVASADCRSVYWMSEPRRRHSEDIMSESRVAGAIAVKTDWPVVGLQFIGTASVVEDTDEMTAIIDSYNKKYDYAAEGFVERFKEGNNKHLLYKISITSLELFDQANFAGDPVAIALD